MRGGGAHEETFDLLAEDLMPPECSAYPVVQANYLWDYESPKKTLKEMEKEVYYSCGEYPDAATLLLHRRFLTG
jgi:hypothetical protein